MRNFALHLRDARRNGQIVLQPRMGFSHLGQMRQGLLAVRNAGVPVAGTLTLDSYTRTGDLRAAKAAVKAAADLNGYPLCSYPLAATRTLLRCAGDDLPVQVRHGAPLPEHIVDRLLSAGLSATEGGPVSYCLPYGRVPLRQAVDAWQRACERLATAATPQCPTHLESFGGCLLGQLCPPSMLIAITVLEGLIFQQHQIPSISLSYAQQTSPAQDLEALRALQRLSVEYLADVDSHIVVYTYMGVYPRSRAGALAVLAESARLAAYGGAGRLIVKTTTESQRIPTIADNVAALRHAHSAVLRAQQELRSDQLRKPGANANTETYADAKLIIEAVRSLNTDLGQAIIMAFQAGMLDVPYCLHPDNAGRTRSRIADDGRLEWAQTGRLPIARPTLPSQPPSASELVQMLNYVANRFDRTQPAQHSGPTHREASDHAPATRISK